MAYTFKHGDRPLDGYTIQRAVGRGGFGEVYYALSDGGREVALKYLRENPDVELRGVSHCINLKSPHLVSIFDVKQMESGEYVIIMEYCSGPSLRDLLIAEPNGFSTEKAAFFTREIGKGLSYLHERGIVHRDLKPGNLFFDDGYVKIGDYGLSKFISVSRHSAQTASVGTVHYMAPEIGSGNYSRGVDIYALGVMLYEMLLGKVPFEGSSMAEVLMKHLTAQPELDHLPQPFGYVIRKALEKDPNDRYQTVDEMVEEMLSGEQIQKSLAGFSPQSLGGAVARGGSDEPASPYPSPNPGGGQIPTMPLPPRPPASPEYGSPLPQRLAKKMDRVSRKIEKKMGKLAGRVEKGLAEGTVDVSPPRATPPGAPPFRPPDYPDGDVPWAMPAGQRTKSFALTGMLTIGVAVGLGIATANAVGGRHADQLGVAAAMLVVMMRLALALANRWVSDDGPVWPQRLAVASPFLAGGTGPAFAVSGGVALFLGLLASAVFADWRKLEDNGDRTISFGCIFGKALGAFVLTAIIGNVIGVGREEDFAMIAAGVAAAVALILQADTSWGSRNGSHRGPKRNAPASPSQPVSPQSSDARSVNSMKSAMAASYAASNAARAASRRAAQSAVAHVFSRGWTARKSAGNDPPAQYPQNPRNDRRLRSGLTRFFWALLAFVFSGATISTFVLALAANDLSYHGRTAMIVGCATFFFAILAMTKATPFARVGFWRGTVRPFMLTLFAFGVGATTTAIARYWNHCEQWGAQSVLVAQCSPQEREDRIARASGRVSLVHTETALYARANARDGTLVMIESPKSDDYEALAEETDASIIRKAAQQLVEHDRRGECVRYTLDNDQRGGLVAGLVLCSLSFLTIFFFTGRKATPPEAFLQGNPT